MTPEVRRFPSLSELSQEAGNFICDLAQTSIEKNGRFTLVLSGGKTPRLLYERLALRPFSARIPWQQTHLFWGDERFVPSNHPNSNFGLASKTLISKVPLPTGNIHYITTDTAEAETAAEVYESRLKGFFQRFSDSRSDIAFPSFDLILLGLGADGHTASLFPGDIALEERERWVVAVPGSRASPPVPRITLTLPVINRAECVMFLISGGSKQRVVHEILTEPEKAVQRYPGAMVRPSGRLLWFMGEATG